MVLAVVGSSPPRRRRRRGMPLVADAGDGYPPCARGLFPLPASVTCGGGESPVRAWLDPADFGFRFADGSNSTGSSILAAAFKRSLQDLKRVPSVVARPGVAEPGIVKPHLGGRRDALLPSDAGAKRGR